jgi:hypothetical protein
MGAAPQVHFRRSARRPVALAVQFGRPDPGSVLRHRGRTTDVSMDGLFVECERVPEVGALLLVELAAPSAWETLSLPAEVRWVSDGAGASPRGFGARFHALDPRAAGALHALLVAADYLDEEGA